ncbi:MAG: 2-succinyl-5-enolpyruvyl-6-hydroxy-3-cyclohexene-1-carboxylic-acid synthase [Balneolaceae bacterium]
MQESDSQNAAFHWSTLFVRSLFAEGVRHAVISPGSRSTALTLAFAAHPGIKKHVIIDERSAAFIALGLAKSTGIPAVLICTSGTALANYFPAVIEAAQSGTPLIIASADRPPKYRGVGASQTIDQIKIFGDYPAFFHEAGEPDVSKKGQKRIQLAAVQAFLSASNKGGVSHVNLPFSKPFEPDAGFLKQVEKENEKEAQQDSPKYVLEKGNTELGEVFWSDLVSAERPLIVVGPTCKNDQISFVSSLAKALNAPVLAEPGSHIPSSRYTIQGFDGFLKNKENQSNLDADLILRFGSLPVSKAVNDYLEDEDRVQISFMNPYQWQDGSLSSDKQIVLSSPLEIPDVTGSAKKSWLKIWKDAEKNFKKFRQEQLHPTTPITDGYVFSKISEGIDKKMFTMLSNSFPVRDLSLFGEFDGKKMYTNRGAAGIDGINSTAIGLSLSLQKPGVLFVGDIAFLHDSNALLSAKLVKHPLVIIVMNNGGGTIFRMLPVYSFKKTYTSYFETPQSVSIAVLCRAHKVDHTLVSRPEQIATTFGNLISKNGLHVMECITDAGDSMKLRQSLWNFEAP